MICLTIMIKTSILQVIFTLKLMMLVMSLHHKDNFNVMPGLPPGNEYLIGVEYAESSIHCASLCVITSTCMTAVLNTTTRMCVLYRQSQPGSANSSLSQDAVLILQKGTTTSTPVSTMQETTFAVESRTTIGSLVSTMKETTEETVTTLVTESSILGDQTVIVLDYNNRNYDDSRQWCQENGNMEIIMIKTVSDYNEVINELTSESVVINFQFWIGLKWDPVQQNFFWFDNTILTWVHWCSNSNEPDCMNSSSNCYSTTAQSEDCVRLTHYQRSTWCFATRSCHSDYKTMCRGAVEPEITTNISVSTTQETTDKTVTSLVTESATITHPKNWTILGAADCYPSTSLEYNGTINYTVSGIPCQYWNTDSPHYRNYLPVDTAAHDTNFCRETNHLKGGPGCYTSNPAVNWEYCYIVKCDACGVDERLPVVPTDTTYLFHVGKFIGMVFTCNTLSPGTSVDHCPVSQCGSDDQWTNGYSVSCTVEDCYTDSTTYQGKVTCTVTGITCDAWTLEGAMPAGPDKNTNYCRDPDNTGAPWCYTTDPNVRWEFCPVRKC